MSGNQKISASSMHRLAERAKSRFARHAPSLSLSMLCHRDSQLGGKIKSNRQGDDVRVGKPQEPARRTVGEARKIHRPAVEECADVIGEISCSHCEKMR
jgi:hypothetical protein